MKFMASAKPNKPEGKIFNTYEEAEKQLMKWERTRRFKEGGISIFEDYPNEIVIKESRKM